MDSHVVIKEILKDIPAKQLAGELGVSLSLIYKWAESQLSGNGASNPLDRVEMLTRMSADDAPLRWLCTRRGGVFVKADESTNGAPPPALRPAACEITREMSLLLVLLGDALATDTLPPASAREFSNRWARLKPLIDAFVIDALRGDYHARAATTAEPCNGHPATHNTSPDSRKYKRRLACLANGE